VTRLENPSDDQILGEFERVVTAFELSKRGIIPGPIRRPVEYLTARNLEVARCLELLEFALAKLREQHEAVPWKRIPKEWAAEMVQHHRASQARVLLLLGRAHSALDSFEKAAEAAERMHALVLEIDAGPDLGQNIHRGFVALYWTLRGEIAEEEGELPDAFAFYQRAGSYPVQLERKEGQSKRVWLLMGGTDEGWTAFSEINRTSLPVP
jgi:tetratricopeptide (TPR) repeat protein